MSDIESLARSKDIVVFSSEYCPYCQQAIAALKNAGYDDRMTVIEASSDTKAQLLGLTKQSTVPQIFVKGTFVGGCNDGPESWMGIKKCLASGKVTELLK